MASAKIKVMETRNVILNLSEEEANVLKGLTEKVGGDPELSPRKHINEIAKALHGAGIPNQWNKYPAQEEQSAVYFLRYEAPEDE